MKLFMKPIQVYALCRENGSFLPMAFCLEAEGEKYKIKFLNLSADDYTFTPSLLIEDTYFAAE